MAPLHDYRKAARENEAVFRNVLRDMRNHREERPMGKYIPEDLETEAPLDEIFAKYSEGNRHGRFTIGNFVRPAKDSAKISFRDIATLSGGGGELEYRVMEDDSVEFKGHGFVMMSFRGDP